jgi:hypothetical protein
MYVGRPSSCNSKEVSVYCTVRFIMAGMKVAGRRWMNRVTSACWERQLRLFAEAMAIMDAHCMAMADSAMHVTLLHEPGFHPPCNSAENAGGSFLHKHAQR